MLKCGYILNKGKYMATYVTSKCPHCGTTIRAHRFQSEHDYGSPLRTCFYCNKSYVDKYYIEIAVDGLKWIDQTRISPGNIIFMIFCAFFMIGGLFFFDSPGKWVCLGISGSIFLAFLWITIGEYRDFNQQQANYEIERK